MTNVVNHHLPSWSAVIVVSIVAVSLAPVSLCSVQQSSSGNGLWDDLMGKCDGPRNTMDCVRSRLYNYVDHTFESDFNITDGLIFTKNSNNYESMCPENNETTTTSYREARAPEMEEEEAVVDDGWSDVTERLYNKGAKYLATHDFEATVPSFLGGGPGARVRLSPKKILPDGGIILRMDVLPAARDARSPRFMHKMIKQLFKKKLMSSGMALMLIIKLIKIKLIFLLPLLIGASAAKKILLKVLLFIFPPLAHLFKLCSYYHHHASKFYHFHHHKVKHHHHHLKIPVPVPVPIKPPPSYHSDYYPAGPTLDHPPPPGPYDSPETLGGGSDYYNRNGLEMNNVVSDHADELASWGLGDYGEGTSQYDAPKYSYSASPAQYEPLKYGGDGGGGPPPSPYAEKYVKRLDNNPALVRPPPALQQVATHDPVYTPIVQKLDEIFHELAVPEESCKEKLVCKMYGDPGRFSPHSNLVSAQLSSETAASSGGRTGVSADAARLWRYVQAAKEGQNGEDCRILYQTCNMIGL
ncbi:PREDICTED: uncharacterized protein LOC107171871 [Diuraphis noxia]|uniref:uncharacterized protein LOC107171871 n=2 Tax=Diuraphis noxia TaxID=143948 RepID=UPI0007635BEC|nr:PREDICTED: uncharacterized protein LOC107171871 [Diuraphis noxia]